jgi:hypothetical protein
MWGCELELKNITLRKVFIEHNSPKGAKVFLTNDDSLV